jgi:hypothetical protein
MTNILMKMKIIKFRLLFVLSLSVNLLYSKPVDVFTAQSVAYSFLKHKTSSTLFRNDLKLNWIYTYSSKEYRANSTTEANNFFYVFNANDSGFIAVSADDIVYPILAYSDESSFNPNTVNSSTQKWFQGYADQIRFAMMNNLEATENIKNQWSDLIGNKKNDLEKRRGSVSPLISTKWNQGKYYNDLCPYDNSYQERTVTGCVATATAQIIKYWSYPDRGTGFLSYNHQTYGTISTNFANHSYDYDNMPNRVSSANLDVALLMFDCGVSVEMDYGVDGSSAQTLDVVNALKTYFSYDGSISGKYRSTYSDVSWVNLLKTELDAGRPIQYAATGNGGGHSFVCDGYDNSDYFHFNWGWGGISDGYFLLTSLNPGSLGSGGGTGGYNSNHRAIVGIKPPDSNIKYDFSLNTVMTISPTTINYGGAFSISVNFTNNSKTNFRGDYGAAIFDDNDNFIDFIEIKSDYSLQSGYKYSSNLEFSTPGMFNILPGKYWLGMYYRPTGGNWDMVKGTFWYSNYKSIIVTNNNSIALHSDLTISGDQYFTQGKSGIVKVNIKNNSSSIFKGKYAVSLYNLDGSFVQTVNIYDEIDGLPAGYVYSNPLSFFSSEINVNPGTYLLAVQHIFDGSNNWQLTGTGKYLNPILVDVQAPPIQADIYEVNDNASLAYNLNLSFSGKNAVVSTTGSNCHEGSDYDFYKVNLANGYNYSLRPRLHDEFNAGNNKTYTLDALFSYSLDGGSSWSDVYDDIMPIDIQLSGGKSIIFKVAPYFIGQTGTYLFEILATRESNLAVEIKDPYDIKIYPNPGKDFVNIESSRCAITKIIAMDLQGREISQHNLNDNKFHLPIVEFPPGVYILVISTSKGDFSKKIIKQ